MRSFIMNQPSEYMLCRLCLCGGNRFIDIFEENNGLDFVVENAIEDLLQLKVVKDDGYPWLVCSTCLCRLTEFRLFKHQCAECQVVFENRIKKGNFPRTNTITGELQEEGDDIAGESEEHVDYSIVETFEDQGMVDVVGSPDSEWNDCGDEIAAFGADPLTTAAGEGTYETENSNNGIVEKMEMLKGSDDVMELLEVVDEGSGSVKDMGGEDERRCLLSDGHQCDVNDVLSEDNILHLGDSRQGEGTNSENCSLLDEEYYEESDSDVDVELYEDCEGSSDCYQQLLEQQSSSGDSQDGRVSRLGKGDDGDSISNFLTDKYGVERCLNWKRILSSSVNDVPCDSETGLNSVYRDLRRPPRRRKYKQFGTDDSGGTDGIRQLHNSKEQMRRRNMSRDFERLGQLVPSLAGVARRNKRLILKEAACLCVKLTALAGEQERDIRELRAKQAALRKRVAMLFR